MKSLLDLDLAALTETLGLPAFRAKQVMRWLVAGRDFDEMTDLSKALRAELAERFVARPVRIADVLVSADGTKKYLYRLSDGHLIEGVRMQNDYGNTLCVSTQVGCRMGCTFCASGLGGLVRNLDAGEILGQVLAVNRDNGGTAERRDIANLVLMGMGEPLDNYDKVVKFLRLVTSADGIRVSARNISLSTCGLVDRIRMLADEGLGVNLTVSLHAATDEARRAIMPIARRWSLAELIAAARYYFEKTGRRVYFEYVLIANKNMGPRDADRLAALVGGFPSHVNLIRLNGAVAGDQVAATERQARAFAAALEARGVGATVRRSLGGDIEGACGQLRRKRLGGEP